MNSISTADFTSTGTFTLNKGTISGNTAGDMVTITQAGAGNVLKVNGTSVFNGLVQASVFQSTATAPVFKWGSNFTIENSTANNLYWRDSGSIARMILDGDQIGATGWQLKTPTVIAVSTKDTDSAFYAAARPTQSADILRVVDSSFSTDYLKVNNIGITSISSLDTITSTSSTTAIAGVNTSSGYAISADTSSGTGIAIYATSANATAVSGSSSSAGAGVYGQSSTGAGVYGQSSSGYGVYGTSLGVGGSLGTPNLTVDASGNLQTAGLGVFGGAISTTGSYVKAAAAYGFRVGSNIGLSAGAAQTLNVTASGGGSCTITVYGGIITATTC
jgi:hypothetical protein